MIVIATGVQSGSPNGKSKREGDEMKKNFVQKGLFILGVMLIAAGAFTPPEPWAAGVTQITVTGAGKGANAFRAMAAVAEVVNQNSKTV